MCRSIALKALILTLSACLSGCLVAESSYLKKADEATALSAELASFQQKNQVLAAENQALRDDLAKLREQAAVVTQERDRLLEDAKQFEAIIKSRSDVQSQNISDLRQQVFDLSAENRLLQEDVSSLLKGRQETVQDVSRAYETLLEGLKDDIATARISVAELRGRVTITFRESALFAGDQTELTHDGRELLRKVATLFSPIKGRVIRVEGYADTSSPKELSSSWEYSAARILTVTRALQGSGLDPAALAAVVRGEHQLAATEDSGAARALNRRIAIVLAPKEAM